MSNSQSFFIRLSRYFLLIALLGVGTMFASMSDSFLKPSNLLDIVRSASIIGMLGIGMTIVQVVGEFDFTIGITASIAMVMMAYIQKEVINHFEIAVLCTIAICLGIALVKIGCVVYLGMHAWIATLGIGTLLTGFGKWLTGGGNYFSTNWLPRFRFWGQGFFLGVVPMPAVVFICLAISAYVFLEKTKTGRHMYAVGANRIAAEYVGINVTKCRVLGFILVSMCSCVAGIILIAQVGTVTASSADGNMMPAISSAMLGATFLRPGTPNITGTFIGSLLLSVIANGLTMINASYHMKDIIQGLVFIISISLISLINMRGQKIRAAS